MFERRAFIFLGCLILACCGLLARAAQLQVAQSADWAAVADESLRRSTYTEPARGPILDRNGLVLAEDVPCNDAAVAYWFVRRPADAGRVELLARDLARATPGYYEAETAEQVRRVAAMVPRAGAVLEAFWDAIAEVGGVPRAEVEARRDVVIGRVDSRRDHLIRRRWRSAARAHERADLAPWWQRWLTGRNQAPPSLTDFEGETIAEEEQSHVILPALTNDQYNALLKLKTDLPPTLRDALVLRASRTRRYPMGPVAAHVVGRVAQVSAEEVRSDPEADDELRCYLPGDLSGKSGLELAAERRLRGRRGRVDHDLDADRQTLAHERESGGAVRTTLDAALTADVRAAFGNVDFRWPERFPGESAQARVETGPMPGAAVVIDLETGGVLAMASYPDYDPNHYEDAFADLVAAELARPLVNRATGFAVEAGSTVKPLVGLGATRDGLLDPHGTIECTGYLIVNVRGRLTRYSHTGRCWTAKMFGQFDWVQGHQTTPDPHPTTGLNPGGEPEPGHLTLADALQRSCNVFFETLGHDGGTASLSEWLDAFGLGRATGVELPEVAGSLPRDITDRAANADAMARTRNAWFGAIGQQYTKATPLQVANAMAAVARGGVWVRPHLLADVEPERIDLGLDPAAVEMARRGMSAVVHTGGGSGNGVDDRLPLEIGAKTGSAQAGVLSVVERDAAGRPVLGESGRVRYRRIDRLSTRDDPNPAAPWYRRSNDPAAAEAEQTHAWFAGYAPAEDPKYAFAVLVEYGGSGGVAAGSVAAQVLQAMVARGYLDATRRPDPERPGHYLVD